MFDQYISFADHHTYLADALSAGSVILHIDTYTMIAWHGGSTINVWNLDGASLDREIDVMSIDTTGDDGRAASPEVLRARADRAVQSWLDERDAEMRARDAELPF